MNHHFLNIFMIWGLGIGDWRFGPIPNLQSPIPINFNQIFNLILINNNK